MCVYGVCHCVLGLGTPDHGTMLREGSSSSSSFILLYARIVFLFCSSLVPFSGAAAKIRAGGVDGQAQEAVKIHLGLGFSLVCMPLTRMVKQDPSCDRRGYPLPSLPLEVEREREGESAEHRARG